MTVLPKKLQDKIVLRKAENAFRTLPVVNELVDFSSNDYLGLSSDTGIFDKALKMLVENKIEQHGARGSRLLSGNHILFEILEKRLSELHQVESALVFNSGYDANLGFFGSVPQRGDLILYDEFIHASIRDGLKLGNAKSYRFGHNDILDLTQKCEQHRQHDPDGVTAIYIVTESVFSMDGDSPDLMGILKCCDAYNCHLVVDEAHALGIFGTKGEGLVQELGIADQIFARIVTFGKALGCHGAAILGSSALKTYLINFSRPFIYTTALPPLTVATILLVYEQLQTKHGAEQIRQLRDKIAFFGLRLNDLNLKPYFIPSQSAIHCCIVPGNGPAKHLALELQGLGFDVKAILSPTVPEGKERLRFCLHAYNTKSQMREVLTILSKRLIT